MKALNNTELIFFCSQLALTLRSGISSLEGLSLMLEDSPGGDGRTLLEQLIREMEETGSLSRSLESAQVFPAYLCSMVELGEQTGHLDDVMESLAAHYRLEEALSRNLRSAVAYPLVMLGIERIVDGKSGRLFCLSLFYGLYCNYYIGFMLCFFSCLVCCVVLTVCVRCSCWTVAVCLAVLTRSLWEACTDCCLSSLEDSGRSFIPVDCSVRIVSETDGRSLTAVVFVCPLWTVLSAVTGRSFFSGVVWLCFIWEAVTGRSWGRVAPAVADPSPCPPVRLASCAFCNAILLSAMVALC